MSSMANLATITAVLIDKQNQVVASWSINRVVGILFHEGRQPLNVHFDPTACTTPSTRHTREFVYVGMQDNQAIYRERDL